MGNLYTQATLVYRGNESEFLRKYIKNAVNHINKKMKEKLDFDQENFFAEIDSVDYSEEEKIAELMRAYEALKCIMKTMNKPQYSDELKRACEQLKNIKNDDVSAEKTITSTEEIHSDVEKRSKWLIVMEENPEVITNRINMRDQKVVVTNLGKYGGRVSPIGSETGRRYKVCDVIGVTKFNSQNEVIKNEVMFARLNPEDSTKNDIYFVDIFVEDEYLDFANEYRNGFLGQIKVKESEEKTLEYVIEHDTPSDQELVKYLQQAKDNPGTCIQNEERKDFSNITECKEKLKDLQLKIAQLENAKKNVAQEKGDRKCQK